MNHRRGPIGLWIAGVFLLCTMYFPGPGGDWYQEARLDTTLAVVTHGTIAIDAYERNTGDKSFYKGHYYSITAPGQSLLGVPLAAAYVLVDHLTGGSPASQGLTASGKHTSYQFFILKYLETLSTTALPGTLFLLLFFWFLGCFTAATSHRVILTLALGLGTDVFAYAQVLYAHLLAALLVFAGFVLMYVVGHQTTRQRLPSLLHARWSLSAALAGLLCGFAFTCEYQTAAITFFVGLFVLLTLPRRCAAWFAAGVLPGILVVAGCDLVAYHNPLVTGYSAYSMGHQGHPRGTATLAWPPHWSALIGLTFSSYRGLFFLSPFFLLSLPGYYFWALRDRARWVILFALVPAAYVCVIAMHPIWDGGISVGPRFLIPMLPFMAIPIAYVLDRAGALVARLGIYGLIAISVLNVWLQTLGGAGYPNPTYKNPLFQYSLPSVVAGQVRANLGSAAFAPLGLPYSPLTLIPLACLTLCWTWFVFRRRGRETQLIREGTSAV